MALMEPAEAPSSLPNPSVPKMYPAPTDVRNTPQYEDADEDGARMRRQRAPPPVPLVDTKALPLPLLDGDLKRGKHDGLLGHLAGTDRQVTITADSGAQVPAVSLRCTSMGWREQERIADTSGDPSKARALTGCERMPVPQRFYGFKGPEGDHEEVDIVSVGYPLER